ncbi:hypothetical protein BDZ97DRAFT_1025087 [Flammula alnicola]|nr:hypothetical protein BDZ97DRAFT_1025087 [Flammula alnicola]
MQQEDIYVIKYLLVLGKLRLYHGNCLRDLILSDQNFSQFVDLREAPSLKLICIS